MSKNLNIVWLKRDLRSFDHCPLFQAEQLVQDYIIIYLFEPNQMNHLDYSLRHQQFIYQSIKAMNKILKTHNREVHIFHANADTVFEYLTLKYSIQNIFSYQETGTNNSWKRDKKVSKILAERKVNWIESENQGVIRGSKNRKGWDKHWFAHATSSIIPYIYSYNNFSLLKSPFDFNLRDFPLLIKYPKKFQPAGEEFALKYLNSFIKERGKNYNRNISQPEKSRYSCGRISTYLAWGNISVKKVYQTVKKAPNYKIHKRAFDAFLSRIKWRSHFIQKFEVECSYEISCINKGYEQMKYSNNNILLRSSSTAYPRQYHVHAATLCGPRP